MKVATDESPGSLPVLVFRDRYARGGGLWTLMFNQVVGAMLSKLAIRAGVTPNQISLVSIVFGVATSVGVWLLYPGSPTAAGVCGLIGWQLAYSLDCSDGQVARATGRLSPHGSALDLLIDFVVHASVALAIAALVSADWTNGYAVAFTGFFTTGMLISPFYEGVAGKAAGDDDFFSLGLARRVIRTIRDYGLDVAILALLLPFSLSAVAIAAAFFAALHYMQLLYRLYTFSR